MRIDETKLGPIVKDIRTELGMTQRELAVQTGLTVNYISLFENGHRGISIPNLNAIAEVLGIPALLFTTLATVIDSKSRSDRDKLLRQIQAVTREAISLYVSAE